MEKTENKRNRLKRPIKRTLGILASAFILIVSALTILISYAFVSSIVRNENSKRLNDVITVAESMIDVDDLGQCAQTNVKSEKYNELQQNFNVFIDQVDIMYLYIVIPKENGLLNILSATSQAERDAGEEDMELGYLEEGYSSSELKHYRDGYDKSEISYFEERSTYGTYFTASKVLTDSNGQKVALLCADIDINALHGTIAKMMAVIGASVIGSMAAFSVIVLFLIRKNITGPIFALEKSARTFAEEATDNANIKKASYHAPDVKTGNEVQSLAEAMQSVASALKMNAEKATTDALTGVKNKHAYVDFEGQLNQNIEQKQTEPFALAVFDIDGLKDVNDTKGHAAGDECIRKACATVCNAFKHSPVFRIGGDEFAVFVVGVDYENLDVLIQSIKEQNERNAAVGEVCVSCGVAKYQGEPNVETLFKRADALMYDHKRKPRF